VVKISKLIKSKLWRFDAILKIVVKISKLIKSRLWRFDAIFFRRGKNLKANQIKALAF
jgi:hypothetical protein